VRTALRHWTDSARRLASRARQAVYAQHDVVLLVKTLDTIPPPMTGRPLRVEIADSRHIALMVELMSKHLGWDLSQLFTTRMASGAGALLAFLGDELIGYLWWADSEAIARVEPLLPIRYGIRLEAHDVYGFDLFVAPEHRGEGTATWFVASAETEFKRLGYERMQSYAVSSNRPARWLFAISGHETAERLRCQVLLSRFLRVNGSFYLATRRGFKRLSR
jgi:GNAT superfamily N-acetyltransferase